MIPHLRLQLKDFYQKFIISFVGISLLFIALIAIYQWHTTKNFKARQFEIAASNLGLKLNDFFDEITESIASLSFYEKSGQSCETILPEIQKLHFNSITISGISVVNLKSNLYCSTFFNQFLSKQDSGKKPTLEGPIKLSTSNEDIYILQQDISNYSVSVYFLRSTLEDFFTKKSQNYEFIGLYNNKTSKMIFYYGNPFLKPRSIFIPKANTDIVLPLQSLKNIELVARSYPYNFIKSFIFSSLVLIIPFIIVSLLFFQISSYLMKKRFSLPSALNQALKDNEFYPAYQPVWDEEKNRFCGAEILIRWNFEADKMIMPDVFIDEAERCGLIIPITLNLIEIAFKECRNLLHKHRDLHLSFNVTPSHFKDDKFFEIFYELCKDYNIRANQVMFELTERELLCHSETETIKKMHLLRKKGFSLAIDDFGAGQANINYLHHFPFNYLKIDKIFIDTIGTNSISEVLTKGIINMAKDLSLVIIAEGVETQAQMEYLRLNEVKYIQGWYYAKALSYREFEVLVDKMNKDSS